MAVYTKVSNALLQEFLTEYDVGQLYEARGILEGVENTNYHIVTSRGDYILTLYEKRVETSELPFFLDLMGHFHKSGFKCPHPIVSKAGKTQLCLAGRPAALISFLDGRSQLWPDIESCRKVGAALAKFHKIGGAFSKIRHNKLGAKSWSQLLSSLTPIIDQVEAGLAAELHEELEYLLAAWPDGLPTGIIHADLFPDNVFYSAGEVSGFIDFYFACNDILAFDLAICLNAWCFGIAQEFCKARFQALMTGYHHERQLSTAELSAIPLLARGAALRFLLTRAHDWLNHPEDALAKPKDPKEFLERLRWLRKTGSHDLKVTL